MRTHKKMKVLFKIVMFFIAIIELFLLLKLDMPVKILNSTYTNDNKDYILEVYRQSNYSSFLGLSSSSGFAEAYVVLKDKQRKVLLSPHWYASCHFLIGDLQIEWQEKVSRVYFTKFNYIDLTTMSFDCY